VKYLGLQKANSDEDKDYNTVRNGAELGTVVTLKVDYRTHSHAQGLIDVVFGVKSGRGAIPVLWIGVTEPVMVRLLTSSCLTLTDGGGWKILVFILKNYERIK
jgi:hypothetical protein